MTDWIQSIIESVGYAGIAFLTFIENVFPPLPSEVIIPFAGYVTTNGSLTIIGVIIAGTIGSVLGALPLYYLGYFIEEEQLKTLADEYGKWFMISPKDIDRASSWFEKRGALAVFVCRLIPGLRSLISIPAGIQNMSLLPFLLLTTLGTAIWTSLLSWAGASLGNNYSNIQNYLDPISYVVFGGMIAWYLYHIFKKTVIED
ncbi:DedA family protein [Gracilimonas mengyeensis]|uniref:Membrane protein DedA, SNARE-associated domain n=1 Tax=Gracilimonas mengyeensis TaxID=1302730 RepID=A0A521D4G6_9BACT|nr:DedA family protein [Gracilimonas mengyeensis]SMO66512.1 membrane protein DedA, SNARE-associated domain [Gracilimonas mengyeensis]